ncbi:MAG: hypothetical protein K0A93_09045 [Desulfuromonadaceae bacterium]|nr:hypothetical protein [Desulfuromonadaceae bacterium]
MTILIVLATQLGLASNLIAATGGREDGSMFLVWIFLGMCALIVIVQLMPAMFLLFGVLKSFYTGNKGQTKVDAISEE